MALRDDVVDWITSEITTIGLATGPNEVDEISGDGYAPLTPTYAASASGTADITATLEFDGPANEGPISHLIFRRTAGVWAIRPVASPASLNIDGRIDVTSAPVSVDWVA